MTIFNPEPNKLLKNPIFLETHVLAAEIIVGIEYPSLKSINTKKLSAKKIFFFKTAEKGLVSPLIELKTSFLNLSNDCFFMGHNGCCK